MRVYVIGASAELDRAERVIAALRERGFVITADWPADVRRARAAGLASDAEVPHDIAREIADANVHAIETADVVVALSPPGPSTGYGADLMAALLLYAMRGRPTHIVLSGAHGTVYDRHAHARFATDEDAIAWIAGLRSAA